jgi:cell division protein DivIC
MAASNFFKPLTNMVPVPFRNRYFLILAIFFAVMIFVDKHDMITQFRLQRTVNKLEQDKRFYEQKIEEAETDRASFEGNKESFAREHYRMKRADEDVYIIEEKE